MTIELPILPFGREPVAGEVTGTLPVFKMEDCSVSTIHDLAMAGIDSLPEGAKELIQTGSVAGREFSHQLIETITDFSKERLWPNLSVLKDSELLQERGICPQSTYVFKHAPRKGQNRKRDRSVRNFCLNIGDYPRQIDIHTY